MRFELPRILRNTDGNTPAYAIHSDTPEAPPAQGLPSGVFVMEYDDGNGLWMPQNPL